MCGIVGYTGEQECTEMLLKGLERLEYRGYDSAGIGETCPAGIAVRRAAGRISCLRKKIEEEPIAGRTGIGHTRWATHGKPSCANAHPQSSQNGRVAVVHNGIIENYKELRQELEAQGVAFTSETDTETVAQLLEFYYQSNMQKTLEKVLPMLKGSFALGILDAAAPNTLYAARRQSPLVIGLGEGETFIASDITALLDHTRTICFLEDDDIAVLTPAKAAVFNLQGRQQSRKTEQISWNQQAAQKGGFDHYMLKEIFDQPKALEDTLNHYIDREAMAIRPNTIPFTKEQALAITGISIAACGTAYHAAAMGKAMVEKLAKIPCRAEVASEFRYDDHPSSPQEVFIAVSQSGETADTLAALRREKEAGCWVLAVSNVIGSTISREAQGVMYTLAGPEIAVASTKAYLTQVLLLTLLALELGRLRGEIDEKTMKSYLTRLLALPAQVEQVLADAPQVKAFAAAQSSCSNIFFIGRLADYYTALEASLKLKEVSYLPAQAYAAGELKHGTIALIDENTLVVGIATQNKVREKTFSNLEEVRARGAKLLLITGEGCTIPGELWRLPTNGEIEGPLLAAVYGQLFAYYMALQQGCDIDKPRNLAKSVTVE